MDRVHRRGGYYTTTVTERRDELHPRERERLKEKVYASVFSIILQNIEDQALSAAATNLFHGPPRLC